MSNARIGYGSTVEISTNGGSTWVEIAEVADLTPPSFTVETVDVTHMQSPGRSREFIAGLNDHGETSFTINWIPGSAADVLLRSLATGFTTFKVRETFPNGEYWQLDGILTSYAPAAPIEDKMSAEITIKVTGAISSDSAVAPTNSVLPAISGTVQVGQTLTAWPGIWTGAPSFSFQWKNGGENIVGAVSQTYVLQAGDQGDNISVTVTGANAAGSASATSAATADVAGA